MRKQSGSVVANLEPSRWQRAIQKAAVALAESVVSERQTGERSISREGLAIVEQARVSVAPTVDHERDFMDQAFRLAASIVDQNWAAIEAIQHAAGSPQFDFRTLETLPPRLLGVPFWPVPSPGAGRPNDDRPTTYELWALHQAAAAFSACLGTGSPVSVSYGGFRLARPYDDEPAETRYSLMVAGHVALELLGQPFDVISDCACDQLSVQAMADALNVPPDRRTSTPRETFAALEMEEAAHDWFVSHWQDTAVLIERAFENGVLARIVEHLERAGRVVVSPPLGEPAAGRAITESGCRYRQGVAMTSESRSNFEAHQRSCDLCGAPSASHLTDVVVNRYQLIRVLRGNEPIPSEWLTDCRLVPEADEATSSRPRGANTGGICACDE